MLHAVEEHAQQVLELSAGAAAEALPNVHTAHVVLMKYLGPDRGCDAPFGRHPGYLSLPELCINIQLHVYPLVFGASWLIELLLRLLCTAALCCSAAVLSCLLLSWQTERSAEAFPKQIPVLWNATCRHECQELKPSCAHNVFTSKRRVLAWLLSSCSPSCNSMLDRTADAKAAAFSPSKGSPRKQALSLGPQLPSRLLSNASRAALVSG
eukprot:scaffold283374_cov19-Tisochrysis_lutea.AAC.2